MLRSAALVAVLLAVVSCRDYDFYPRLADERGVVPADQFARYGREQAQQIAIGREFARAYQGDTPEARARQAAAAVAYARTMPDVVTVTADTLGYRLTVEFKSGWRTAILPIDDGKRGADTPNLPPGAGQASPGA